MLVHGDVGALQLSGGTGVKINHNASGTVTQTISWDSLRTTGFEVEGGQKVVCLMTGANYFEDRLPCPRGRVMRLPDYASG